MDSEPELEREEIDFDALVDWLNGHEGDEVGVSMLRPAEGDPGNTGLHAHGVLHRSQGMQVIDARPGRILRYEVGGAASVQILEGDFVAATRIEDFPDRTTIVSVDLKDATLVFGTSASSAVA